MPRYPHQIDLAILTALPVEWEAMRDRIVDSEAAKADYPSVLGRIGDFRVAVCMSPEKGSSGASTFATRIIDELRPKWLFVVGIAGALPDNGLALGDVVVGTKVYCYQYGRVESGEFQRRDDWDYPTDQTWAQYARLAAAPLAIDSGWHTRIRVKRPDGASTSPSVDAGPIASADLTVEDPTYTFVRDALRHTPRALAVETESAGVASAIRAAVAAGQLQGWLIIRGVSDLPHPPQKGKKPRGKQQREIWKSFAADAAAAFVEHLLIYRSKGSEDASLFVASSPSRSPALRPSLVSEPADFVGRQSQIQQLNRWRQDRMPPLAALLGPPGVGKSCLLRKWMGGNATACYLIDAAEALTDDHRRVVSHIFERLACIFGWDSQSDVPPPVEELAQWVRGADIVILLDQFEKAMDPRQSNVGRCSSALTDFFASVVTIDEGPGQLLIASTLRPQYVVEQRQIDEGRIRVIAGESRDPLQMGGLSREDALDYLVDLYSGRGGIMESLPGGDAREIVARFGGHPLALKWFAQLSMEDTLRFLRSVGAGHPLFTQLQELLRSIVAACGPQERELLAAMSILRRPENAALVSRVAQIEALEAAVNLLDSLRRRSLAEYGLTDREGYSVHGIVREWIAQARSKDLTDFHLRAALLYSQEGEPLATAYHFKEGGDFEESKRWRNVYTRDNIESGRQAYFQGDFETAYEATNELLSALQSLPQTESSPRYISQAYLNRAVCQHHISVDLPAEFHDMRLAMDTWSENIAAITFYGRLLRESTVIGIPWETTRQELSYLVPLLRRQAGSPNEIRHPEIAVKLTGFLQLWAENEIDLGQRRSLLHELRSYLSATLRLKGKWIDDEHNTATTIRALLAAVRVRDAEGNDILLASRDLPEMALERHSGSQEIVFLAAAVYYEQAGRGSSRAERATMLRECIQLIDRLDATGPLQPGFLRLVSKAAERASRLLDSAEAISVLEQTLRRVERNSTRSGAWQAGELATAKLRLLKRLAQYTEIRPKYWPQALKMVSTCLNNHELLLPETARLIIPLLQREDELEQGDQPEGDSELSEDEMAIEIKRPELTLIDDALSQASRIHPSLSYGALRLQLRTTYLARNWHSGSEDQPRVLKEARAMAKELEMAPHGEDTWGLIALADFWRLVATRTFFKAEFEEAVDSGLRAFHRLRGIGEVDSSYVDLREAEFLRAIVDYAGARSLLRRQSDERFDLRYVGLFLDIVAHCVHASVVAAGDPELVADATRAARAYRQYLAYLGMEREDPSGRRSARRMLCWLRCRYALGEELSLDFSWIDLFYRQIEFADGRMGMADRLGAIAGTSDVLAQLIGHHCDDGTFWREVGTFLSATFGAAPAFQETALRFWRTAQWWFDNPSWSNLRMGRQASRIAELNIARALLQHPVESELWRQGVASLSSLVKRQRMAWVYHRFVLDLWESISVALRQATV